MISARYLDIPLGGVAIIDTMTRMGEFFFQFILSTLIVPYKRGGMGLDGYSSKQILFVNLFSLQSFFGILFVSLLVGSLFAIFRLMLLWGMT